MPAVAITNVMPIARTPTTLAWVSMLRTLAIVGNVSGLRIAPTTNSSTTTIASAYSCSSSRGARGAVPRGRSGHWTSSARTGASVGRDGVAQQLLLRRGRAVDLGDDLALAHDEDAAADAHELLELGGDDEHAQPALREVA